MSRSSGLLARFLVKERRALASLESKGHCPHERETNNLGHIPPAVWQQLPFLASQLAQPGRVLLR